jgi:hypothetical protein
MTSLFENLNSPYAAMEDDSGQRVLHVRSPHVLVQAAGYLKHAPAAANPCSVLFRGQARLHKTLMPGLYRGAIVQTYEPDGLEVEFVTACGRTQALVTLRLSDVRAVMDEDLIAVRPLTRGAA